MVAAAAIMASIALPPSRCTDRAACAASACGATAMPRVPRMELNTPDPDRKKSGDSTASKAGTWAKSAGFLTLRPGQAGRAPSTQAVALAARILVAFEALQYVVGVRVSEPGQRDGGMVRAHGAAAQK